MKMVVQKNPADPRVAAVTRGDQLPLAFECCEGKSSFGWDVFIFRNISVGTRDL